MSFREYVNEREDLFKQGLKQKYRTLDEIDINVDKNYTIKNAWIYTPEEFVNYNSHSETLDVILTKGKKKFLYTKTKYNEEKVNFYFLDNNKWVEISPDFYSDKWKAQTPAYKFLFKKTYKKLDKYKKLKESLPKSIINVATGRLYSPNILEDDTWDIEIKENNNEYVIKFIGKRAFRYKGFFENINRIKYIIEHSLGKYSFLEVIMPEYNENIAEEIDDKEFTIEVKLKKLFS